MATDQKTELQALESRLASYSAVLGEKCEFVRQNIAEGVKAADTLDGLVASCDLSSAAPDQILMLVNGVTQILRAQILTMSDLLNDISLLPQVIGAAPSFDEAQLDVLRALGLNPQE